MDERTTLRKNLLIIGAGSRVGQLLHGVWGHRSNLFWISRDDLSKDDGPAALAEHIDGIDVIICLAGATPGPSFDKDLNRDIGLAVVEAAHLSNSRPRVMLASTMAVYGAGAGPCDESDVVAPLNAYGRSKLEMEGACLAFSEEHGISLCALRIGNVVGADMLFRNIEAGNDIEIDVFDDGSTPRRSYVDPERLALISDHLVATDDLPEVLNLAADPPLEMGDLADAAGVIFQKRPAPAGAVPDVAMDLRLLARHVPAAAKPVSAIEAVAALGRARSGK